MKLFKVLASAAILGAVGIFFVKNNQPTERETFEAFLAQHPYNNIGLSYEEIENLPKKDRPDLAFQQDFLRTLDPKLGRPTPERLFPTIQQLNSASNTFASKTSTVTWEERGPTNVGGRTRALMFDPNDSTGKKVWAGGVAGGLWYNDDISLFSSSWILVDDFWANMATSVIAYDPTNTQIFYVGTGEGYGNIDAVRGSGVWKTTDGGITWSQLASTSNSPDFRAIFDIDVNPVNGDVYASTNTSGLQRSQDGGLTWTKVLGSGVGTGDNRVYKVDITESGTVWAAVRSNGIYKSYSGNANSFTKLNSTSNGFSPSPQARTELVVSKSDTNICYVLSLSGGTPRIFRTNNGGSTWTSLNLPSDADPGIPANDFTRSQSWYDYIIAVNPADTNHVIVGGVDLFESRDGGNSWDQLSHWYSGFGYQYVHADQHNIIFRDDTSNVAVFAHDGGVSYTPNAKGNPFPVIATRIKDYNTTQFYGCDIHPDAGSNYFIAGAQDNGTQQFSQAGVAPTVEVTGGDGGFCYIDQDKPDWQLTSFTRNAHSFSADGGLTFGRLNSSDNTGSFINPGDYDDDLNILYTRSSGSSIKRTFINGNLNPITDAIQPGINGTPTHVKVSPYTKGSSTLYVGTSSGRVYKVTGANGLSPSSVNLTTSNLPSGSVSCVAVGANENNLIATYSNYGVSSVWYTSDGGSTWNSIEGNLPDMPVRWALFNPNDYKDVILATELGVWQCTDITAASPVWNAENTGLANVRIDMLQMRESDGTVAAATHARGLYTSDLFYNPNPVAKIAIHREIFCVDETFEVSNQSINATGYQWSVSPNTFNFVNGTNATSANPEIEFTADDNYTIQLIATSSTGSDTTTTATVVGNLPIPFNEDFSGSNFINRWKIENIDMDITWELRQLSTGPAVSMQNNGYVGASILGQVDDLISPPLDFTGSSNPILNFNYSYTDRPSQSDSLGIFFSKDCGETWSHIHTYSDYGQKMYRTTIPRNNAFTPSVAAQWCGAGSNAPCGFVDLSPYVAQKDNIRIMFRNYSHQGNNLYIGEINITESSIGIEEDTQNKVSVYPNPTNGITTLQFDDIVVDYVDLTVSSIDGKIVERLDRNNLSSNKISLDMSSYDSGVYIISGTVNSERISKKIIKQ
jgi:photosystem II stability/assembly factor-like uncharacterized protein